MKLASHSQTGYIKATLRDASGKRRVISTGTKSMAEAKKIATAINLEAIELAAKTGRMNANAIAMLSSSRKITIQIAIHEWQSWMASVGFKPRTIYNNALYAAEWASQANVDHLPPSIVTEKHIMPWINDPKSKAKARSRMIRVCALRSLFKFCSIKGWCAGNPAKGALVDMDKLSIAQKETRPRRVFTDNEVFTLVAAAADKYGADSFWPIAIIIARFTGLRIGDIARLEWASIQPTTLLVWTHKRSKRVSLPLKPKVLVDALKKIPLEHADYCFPTERRTSLDVSARSLFSVQFGRLCESVGIEGRTLHDLRSTYCSDMAKKGLPMEHISELAGHSSTSTTKGYIVK